MALLLQVKVRPQSRESRLEAAGDGSWRALLKAPPVDGQANAELVALVARHFGVRRADVSIQSGAAARLKRVRVEGLDAAQAPA